MFGVPLRGLSYTSTTGFQEAVSFEVPLRGLTDTKLFQYFQKILKVNVKKENPGLRAGEKTTTNKEIF
jgi:hypothetical protein